MNRVLKQLEEAVDGLEREISHDPGGEDWPLFFQMLRSFRQFHMASYREALLLAIPTTDADNKKESVPLEGDIPSPIKPPKGCKFHTRCRYCTDICKEVVPDFVEVKPGHFVACHHRVDHPVV